MTRPYPHRPDPERAERNYKHTVRVIAGAQKTAARPHGAQLDTLNAGMDAVWEAVAWGWLLEKPLSDLRGHAAAGVNFVHLALGSTGTSTVELKSLERWAESALLGRDHDAAAQVGRLPQPAVDQPVREFSVLLLALTREDHAAAQEAVGRVRAMLETPTTTPDEHFGSVHLDRIATAVLAGDQAALDSAVADRNAEVARYYRRPSRTTKWAGVLDRRGVALVALAIARGLRAPAVAATIPAELLEAEG